MQTKNKYDREILRTNDEVYFTVFRNGIPMKKGMISFSGLPWWKMIFRTGAFQREKVMNRVYRMAHITVDKIINNALTYEVYDNSSRS